MKPTDPKLTNMLKIVKAYEGQGEQSVIDKLFAGAFSAKYKPGIRALQVRVPMLRQEHGKNAHAFLSELPPDTYFNATLEFLERNKLNLKLYYGTGSTSVPKLEAHYTLKEKITKQSPEEIEIMVYSDNILGTFLSRKFRLAIIG